MVPFPLADELSPGFASPVIDAQVTFRAVLNAMSHPGQVHAVAVSQPPAPLSQAAAATLLTLVDHETKLWIDPPAVGAAAWIAFHTGAPKAISQDNCDFALALTLPDLSLLPNGTDEAPETSATVILQVGSLDSGRRYRLSGPGLRMPATVAITGLPSDFAALWQHNHARFPRGVDLIMCAGDHLMALPRSIFIEEA